MKRFIRWLIAAWKAKPGDWMADHLKPGQVKPAAALGGVSYYDPDEEGDQLKDGVLSPMAAFGEAFRAGKATVSEAWLFESKVDERGRMIPAKAAEASGLPAYRIARTAGNDKFKQKVTESDKAISDLVARNARLREARDAIRAKIRSNNAKFSEDGGVFLDDTDVFGGAQTQFDPLQYTEYTPLYGGPYFKQLYLYDYLKMHSLAFEAWNHNPLAKRIINLLSQYALGRGYKASFKDENSEKAWKDFSREKGLPKLMRMWVRERLLYGELMLNNETWTSIDPSTVWDIITDPDNIQNVYYYHQQYPTAYFQFTGKQVPGVPGSDKTAPIEYIIRQIPFDRVIHLKGESVSNEKRGRSILFPVLGWLKRIKDLYNAEVVRSQLQAAFIFDDMVKGSNADVAAHAAQYASMPLPGSVFAHNESVERKPMPILPHSASSQGGIGPEILAFVATAVGIPKDFFNVLGTGGSRATALVGAEPFSKVIEELQVEFEELLHRIAAVELPRRGAVYDRDDAEFIFPSVTKDTTTETMKNIALSEAQGYVSKRTAGAMAAAELNITTYDYDDEQNQMRDDKAKGIDQLGGVPAPAGRFGDTGSDSGDDTGSPIHGDGKVDLKDQMNNV